MGSKKKTLAIDDDVLARVRQLTTHSDNETRRCASLLLQCWSGEVHLLPSGTFYSPEGCSCSTATYLLKSLPHDPDPSRAITSVECALGSQIKPEPSILSAVLQLVQQGANAEELASIVSGLEGHGHEFQRAAWRLCKLARNLSTNRRSRSRSRKRTAGDKKGKSVGKGLPDGSFPNSFQRRGHFIKKGGQGMQAAGKRVAVSEPMNYGWPNKRPELAMEDTDGGWDPSARTAAANSTHSLENGRPGPGNVELLGTRTESSSSSSSSSNRVGNGALHQDAVASSQPHAAETAGMAAGGAQWPQHGRHRCDGGLGREGQTSDALLLGMGAAVPHAKPDNYKMTYCKFWDSGKCSRGAHCTFAHGIDELRGGLTPKNLRIMEEAQKMMMAMDPRGPQWPEEALNRDNVPAAFRTVAFQQRLQTSAKGLMQTLQWP